MKTYQRSEGPCIKASSIFYVGKKKSFSPSNFSLTLQFTFFPSNFHDHNQNVNASFQFKSAFRTLFFLTHCTRKCPILIGCPGCVCLIIKFTNYYVMWILKTNDGDHPMRMSEMTFIVLS